MNTTVTTIKNESGTFEVNAGIEAPNGEMCYANGATITDDLICAYLDTWSGQHLTTYRVTSVWDVYTKHLWKSRWCSITATYNGRVYYGRYNSDNGQLVALRPYKHQ